MRRSILRSLGRLFGHDAWENRLGCGDRVVVRNHAPVEVGQFERGEIGKLELLGEFGGGGGKDRR